MKSCLIVKPHCCFRSVDEATSISDLKQHYYQTALAVEVVVVEVEGGYRILKNKNGVLPKAVVSSNFLHKLLEE